MTLNGEMALILHYFTEFVYDVVVNQLLGLPRFQNLLFSVHVRYLPSPFRLSVCCLWRWCTLLRRLNFSAIFSPYDSPGTLLFWYQKSLVGTPLFPLNLRSKWPTPFQTAQFRPISAHSASIVIASEKSSISTYRKSTTRFPTSHRWTVYVTLKSPPKGGTKTRYRCLCQ